MVSLPDCQFSYMQEKTQKPNFFFRNVELAMDGFKFIDFEEFEVRDHIPTTTKKLTRIDCEIYMNDFFIVFVGIGRRVATIIYRKNLKYVRTEDEIPNAHPPPHFLDMSCFKRKVEGKYYAYLKLLEAGKVKLTFDSHVQKIVLNGDQIFFMFGTFIFIYTPLSTCTMKIAPVDIAINFYFYVLTADKVLIYNEALYKTIDIDKKCKFIVPTPGHIFVIKSSFIYKIADNSAELYFDTLHHVRDVVFDDRFMYVATKFSIMRIGLYEPSSESIQIKVTLPKLKICDDYIILYDTSNGVGFIDKNNLQRFCFKMLNWDLVGLAAYKNEVAYLGCEEMRLFRFVEHDGNLEPEISRFWKECTVSEPVRIRQPSEIAELISSRMVPSPYNHYGMTFGSTKSNVFEKLKLFMPDHQKELDEDLKRLLHEPEKDLCAEETSGNGCKTAESPYLYGAVDSMELQRTEQMNEKAMEKILMIDDILQRNRTDLHEDTASEESSSGMFFDDREYLESKKLCKDPLLEHISRKTSYWEPRFIRTEKQRMYSLFTSTYSRHTINNPYTYFRPLDAFDKGYMRLIRFTRRYETYQQTSFFCKNHFKFFKRRFRPRSEEEKTPRYHIYNLIQEEFKKIVGYKTTRPSRPEKRVDFSRRVRGGF